MQWYMGGDEIGQRGVLLAWGGSLRAAVRIPGLRMTYNIMEQCNIIVGRKTELLTLPPLLACAPY